MQNKIYVYTQYFSKTIICNQNYNQHIQLDVSLSFEYDIQINKSIELKIQLK